MKIPIRILLAYSILATLLLSASIPPETFLIHSLRSTLKVGCEWIETFNDHFDGQTVDSNLWITKYPSGGGGEQQYYGPDAFQLGNSELNIIAAPIPAKGKPYTSGIIITRGKFEQQYGRFEIKAKLPNGKGFWPAFWLLPVKPHFPYEIDVMENLGHDLSTVYMSYHWKDETAGNTHKTFTFKSPTDYSSDFHIFRVDWTPTGLIWYVDGVEQFRMDKNVPKEPMFLLVNLAVGGHWPGNPDSTTQFPGVMQIDYVRVYKQVCTNSLNLNN